MGTTRETVTRGGHFAVMPGTLAYLDTFAGLVPCRVDTVTAPGAGTITLTATRGAYRRGELLPFDGNDRVARVVPRTAVYVRGGQYRIAGAPVVAYPAPGERYPLEEAPVTV